MDAQVKISGSKADAALACAGSLEPTATPYNPQSDEANEGTAKHAALAYVARGEEPPFAEIAERFQVEVDELERAAVFGRQSWAELSKWMPNALTEQRVEGPVTMGTADVLSVVYGDDDDHPETLAVLDWKTGRSGDEHPYQLMAYADAARAKFGMPASGYVSGFEVWTALREQRTRNFTVAELDGFRERAAKQIARIGEQYAAGPHCKFCPRQYQCPARDEYLRGTVAALVTTDGEQRAITREVLGTLYERSKIITRALAAYGKLLDEALADGPIALPDGRVLGLKTVERDELDGCKTSTILSNDCGFTEDDLSEVLSATKSGIERVVKSKVAKGGGAAAMRQILGKLREAGAITKITLMQKEITDP